MKTLVVALMASAVMEVSGAYAAHGGGNGGDDLELELKKRSLQIGYFVKSDMGSKVFKNLNPDALVDMTNNMDIDVTSSNVTDKYGTLRTCVNEPERSLITCNLARINALRGKKEDILTATLFHEILGLMEIELGHQENVSMYPISSKIIPYHSIVVSTPISEAQIRPEFYGLDSRSYGLSIENEVTKETIRMICLNSNIEIHRCRNYAVVRNANGLQAPLVPSVISLTPAELAVVNLDEVKPLQLKELEVKLLKVKNVGYKFNSFEAKSRHGGYLFGVGCIQWLQSKDQNLDIGSIILFGSVFGCTELDLAIEASKQTLNLPVWPAKVLVNAIRSASFKSQIKTMNSKVNVARKILNLENKLSLVGTTQSLSDEDFNLISEILTQALTKK